MKTVTICNTLVPKSAFSKGAKCYVLRIHPPSAFLLIRSRSGRWIRKWEKLKNLGNFRDKQIPPEHPRYEEMESIRY